MDAADETTRVVRVPASTSNLGPGFDLLGLALGLHVEVRQSPLSAADHERTVAGPAAEELAGLAPDRTQVAFDRAAAALGVSGRFRFEITSEVPVGRGFGSSGAAVAAGLLLAAARAGDADVGSLLPLGIDIEGHPDNVTASLFGGCTLCHPDPGGGPAWFACPVHPSIGFVLAWPPTALPTERARAALPEQVAHADAIENPRRLAFLLEGLRTGEPRWLAIGGEERLHVRHRLALLPGAAEALAAARAAGAWTATISGAGSGLVALAPHERTAGVAAALREALAAACGAAEARVVEPVHGTPRVETV